MDSPVDLSLLVTLFCQIVYAPLLTCAHFGHLRSNRDASQCKFFVSPPTSNKCKMSDIKFLGAKFLLK